MRGLPHIHGVAWLDDENLKDCLNEEGLFREDKEGEESIIKLVDEWMKCTLKFGHADQKEKIKTLNSVIKEKKDKKSVLDAEIDTLDQKYKVNILKNKSST